VRVSAEPTLPRRPRVLLAEDHTLVREGLRQLLAPHVDVVGALGEGRGLRGAIDDTGAEVVLLDISMPGLNGLDAAAQLRRSHPQVKVIIVTMHAEPDYVVAAFRAGACGYVVKSAASAELITALATVLADQRYLSPQVAAPADPQAVVEPLTPRQREVLQLVAEGRTAREIAEILAVSRKTVEFHKSSIMRQLGLHTTAELTRYALSRGLVGPT
jgi:DNA-binding NarL/FixJ family response regulator